jgi:hypothetical protein
MAGKTVPVSAVPFDVVARLETLTAHLKTQVSTTAARAIDRSTVCRLAICDLLDRYEREPAVLAERLGLATDEGELGMGARSRRPS